MLSSLNRYPYFDDYSEDKDFHKILFKPGIPVQVRELTQLQTILQTQISRFGDHVFTNGSRVSGGQITANMNVFAVKVTNNSTIMGVKSGTYIKGATSGLVGEVVQVIDPTTTSSAALVYVVITQGSNGEKFETSEQIYFYSDYTLTTQSAIPVTTSAETTTTAMITGKEGFQVLTANDISKVKTGAWVSSLGAYVISVDTNSSTFKINQILAQDLTNVQTTFTYSPSTPTVLFGVSDGIFYINGYFDRVGLQQIVPTPENRWCSQTIGLIQNEEIIDSDQDSTLLDPAQGSYNYSAPGADRLKLSLQLVAYEQNTVTDPNFIELLRIEDGIIVRQNKNTSYSELMDTLARRTYDESGNYVVNPFIINMKDEGAVDTVTAVINPGKAYVGGYEFETITPLKLQVDRALDTETAANFTLDTYVGSYVRVDTLSGTVPEVGTILTIKQASVTKGTAKFMGLSPDSSGSGNMRVYLSDISGVLANGMTLSTTTPAFSSTIVADAVDASVILYDSGYKLRVYPFQQSYVKNVSNLNYKTKRIFNVTFAGGVVTITLPNLNEKFIVGSGATISQSTQDAHFSVILPTGEPASFAATFPTVGANSQAQCTITLPTNYTGDGVVVTTIDVNNATTRVKTLASALVSIPALSSSTYTSLGYADLYKVKYAVDLSVAGVNKGKWVAGAYDQYDVVFHNDKIYQATAAATSAKVPGVDSVWAAYPDITSTLIVDNGQRDHMYDHASVKGKAGRTNVFVLFDYFAHSGEGVITVNSYPVDYTEIPSYTLANGYVVDLKDAIDARPRRLNGTANVGFDSFQIPDDGGIEVSVEYYMPRIDKIVLTNSRNLKVLRGISSYTQPLPPTDLSDAMTLATLMIPPYTNDVKSIQVRTTNNRRYTMKDIGVIDQRLGNVEYYTSMNTLESKVLNSTQYNPSGTELFKAGFLADNFETFNVGNVQSPEYKCSIDTSVGICRPMFKMNSIQLVANMASSTAKKTGDLVTLPYQAVSYIKNVLPTSYMNINPFNVLRNIGIASITPSSDYWFSTNELPVINTINENTDAFVTAQTQAASANANSMWGAWNTIWTGIQKSNSTAIGTGSKAFSTTVSGRTASTWRTDTIVTTTTTTNTQQSTKAVQSVSASTLVNSDTTKIVSRDVQPYIRAKDIAFTVDGLTPYTDIHVWIDDDKVDSLVTPAFSTITGTVLSTTITEQGAGYTTASATVVGDGTGATVVPVLSGGKVVSLTITNAGQNYTGDPVIVITGTGTITTVATATASITVPSKGSQLTTDSHGKTSGVFHMTDGVYACGSHKITFNDNTQSNLSDTCQATAIYTAEGYVNNTQRDIVSTRMPVITTSYVNREQTVTSTTKENTASTKTLVGTRTIDTSDPLAQTFFVETGKTPNGVFLESIDLYFQSKDQSMPVIVEIRPTTNGYPSSSTILPFSQVTQYPDVISTSGDGSISTKFTFPSPLFLVPGEYAIVVKTGSNKYNLFVSEMSKAIIGSTKVVSEQPYIGSLFESQNASTWTPDQFKDLCFEIFKCEFSKTPATVVLSNSEFGVNADIVHPIIENIQPSSTSITAFMSLPTYSGNIVIDTDFSLPAQSTINSVDATTIQLTLTTQSADISPVIDLERTALICIENIINNNTALAVQETSPQLGSALAKYVAGRVTLNQGFNASNLVVYVDVNRPQGASIEVYYRVKNEFDTSNLTNHNWVKMVQEINGGNTSQEDQYVEDKWSAYDVTYTNGTTFTDFNMYDIKVVMFSANTSNVPVLADVRAIALA